VLSYEPVNVSLVEPRKRDYSKGKAKAAQVPQPGAELKAEGREQIWVEQGKVKEDESFKNVDNEK